MTKVVTIKRIRELVDGFSNDKAYRLMGHGSTAPLIHVMRSADFLLEQKIRIASYHLDPKSARLFACWCAERVGYPFMADKTAIIVAKAYAYGAASFVELCDAYWGSYASGENAATAATRCDADRAMRDAARHGAWFKPFSEKVTQVERITAHLEGWSPLK